MRLREGFYEFLLILHHGQNRSPKFLCGHPNPSCVRMRLCLKTGCFFKEAFKVKRGRRVDPDPIRLVSLQEEVSTQTHGRKGR